MLSEANQKILTVFHKNEASELLSLNYLNRGVCYIYKGIPDSVNYCFEKSLEYARNSRKNEGVFRAYVYLGVFNQEEGNYDLAIEYFNKAKELLNIPLNFSNKILLFESLSDCYMYKGDFELAHENRMHQVVYIDSLKQQGYLQQAFSLDYKFEFSASF